MGRRREEFPSHSACGNDLEVTKLQGKLGKVMRNQCMLCGKQLELWERVWGRFDHARCRSSAPGLHPGCQRVSKKVPTQKVWRPEEQSQGFQASPQQLFAASEGTTFWQRGI